MSNPFALIPAIRAEVSRLRDSTEPDIATAVGGGKWIVQRVTYPNGPKRASVVVPISGWMLADDCLDFLRKL